ncbi:hypothetical protein EWM64_g10362 [Hericium alpestre]|uniref:Uncharacterized protein n=1 Tax=Hericium alpestre TaxID=135208 RepID=A0A4Y9ZHK1_9AGAM|nr:hypothetical protein EWM64_g10362 [Hericium alpestre]
MTAILAPIAKATKCLEAVETTVCDVYLYWLAVMATFQDMFSSDNDNSLSLPYDLISKIRSLVNARYQEMIDGPGKEIYLTGFFLNPRYITSDILHHHERNPLGTRIVIRRPDVAQAGKNINVESPLPPGPDDDLRKAIPCYAKVANYLGLLLKHAIPDAPPRLFKGLNTAKDIWKEFRCQLAQYARMEHPFNKGCDDISS